MEKQIVFVDDDITFNIDPELIMPEYPIDVHTDEMSNSFLPPPPTEEELCAIGFEEMDFDSLIPPPPTEEELCANGCEEMEIV